MRNRVHDKTGESPLELDTCYRETKHKAVTDYPRSAEKPACRVAGQRPQFISCLRRFPAWPEGHAPPTAVGGLRVESTNKWSCVAIEHEWGAPDGFAFYAQGQGEAEVVLFALGLEIKPCERFADRSTRLCEHLFRVQSRRCREDLRQRGWSS
jgi:hypothetical protein